MPRPFAANRLAEGVGCGSPLKADLLPVEAVWFCVRRNGAAKREGWIGNCPLAALRGRIGANPGELVEACVIGDVRRVKPRRFGQAFRQRNRGILGIGVASRRGVRRIAPTRMITANLRFERALDKLLGQGAFESHGLAANDGLHSFFARQFLLPANGGRIELLRGATLVDMPPSQDEMCAAELAEGVGQWMMRNLSSAGALPYKYWPSRGEESPADNAIRRFLGTLSLARLGELRNCAEIREAAQRNLRFNMARYFRNIGDGCGAIVEPAGAKLGAAALAALAILESPAQGELQTELAMLATGVERLADAENGFRTFFFPKRRDGENWNFYSGEALLFWAEARRRGADFAPSLERCAAIFERCRARHRRTRNPAFVPWHTQACASLFAQTGGHEYRDFAFEMSDWLAPMQQWSGVALDLQGRFYDPKRPEFGPPHAASTGAYLEGYADALALARAIGDQGRANAYQRILSRGLRSLRQLQFRDWRDAFYISQKRRVMGALRTEAYDNAVRVDSAAHALSAAIKVLRPLETGPGIAQPARATAGLGRMAAFPKTTSGLMKYAG